MMLNRLSSLNIEYIIIIIIQFLNQNQTNYSHINEHIATTKQKITRTVRGSDYSPAIELSEQKDKLVTATGDTEKYSEKQANKVWLNSIYWFSRY